MATAKQWAKETERDRVSEGDSKAKNDNEKSEIKAQQQRQQHRQTAEWQTKQNSTAKSKELNNCFETGSGTSRGEWRVGRR